jgi:outer membrane protein assembly factor BamA
MLKGGVVYDTRDNEPNPMSGIWADAVLQYFTTNLNGNGNGGVAKLTATFRQYFTIIPNDLSFAYRVIAQQTVAGKSPFYIAPVIGSSIVNRASFEGMGGAYSLRGIFRNRVVGDGIVMVNTELRYKFWRLRLLNQNFYWAITMFGDGGMVTDKVDVKMPNLPQEEQALYFKDVAQRPHFSYGVGGKLAMNQNFVISGDIGKAVSSQDGSIGVYIGVNFLF